MGGDHGLGFTDLGIGKVELIKGPASIMFGADALAEPCTSWTTVIYLQEILN